MHAPFDENLFVSPPLCKTDSHIKEELVILNMPVHISARQCMPENSITDIKL
jgi:hypothetical protein